MSDINSTNNIEQISSDDLSDDQLVSVIVHNQDALVDRIEEYVDDNQEDVITALEDVKLSDWDKGEDGLWDRTLGLEIAEDGLSADGESLRIDAVLVKYHEDASGVEKEQRVIISSLDSACLRELFPQLPAPGGEELDDQHSEE